MLWSTVWAVLVVGAVVGAFFVVRSVYRSGRELVRELGRAQEVAGALLDRAEELAAAAQAAHPLAPVELTDREPALRRVAVNAEANVRRRDARAARHERAYRRWRSFSR